MSLFQRLLATVAALTLLIGTGAAVALEQGAAAPAAAPARASTPSLCAAILPSLPGLCVIL